MNRLKSIDWLALVLVVVGGLNWGLVGIFGFDLVATIFGEMSVLSRIVYTLVGISAVYLGAIAYYLRRQPEVISGRKAEEPPKRRAA
jgi:uncharacterized membrane protein YuzA (DUF378 family)